MSLKHIFLFIAVAAVMASCAQKPKPTPPSPLVIKAGKVATEAAKLVAETDHADTLAMQNAILEAKAQQAEFQVAGDTAAVNAYNRAFKQYLVEHDAKLAAEMFPARPDSIPADEPWDEFEQLVEDPEPQK